MVLQPSRCLAAVRFRRLGLAVSQVPLPIGLAGFVMLVEELRSILMHLGGLVMNGRRILMCPDMPTLMLLVQALPVGFAHNPRLSSGRADSNGCSQRHAPPAAGPGHARSLRGDLDAC